MRYFFLILSLFVTLQPHQIVAEGKPYENIKPGGVITASIDSPSTGQAVQGSIVIHGNTSVGGFQSEEIDFISTGDRNNTWLLVQESTLPSQDGILAGWVTNTITSGVDNLRHLFYKFDGSRLQVMAIGLRVRDHSRIVISTANPAVLDVTLGSETLIYTSSDQGTFPPVETSLLSTPTPLPVNPGEVTASQVVASFSFGAALALGLLVLLGAYAGIRSFLKGRK